MLEYFETILDGKWCPDNKGGFRDYVNASIACKKLDALEVFSRYRQALEILGNYKRPLFKYGGKQDNRYRYKFLEMTINQCWYYRIMGNTKQAQVFAEGSLDLFMVLKGTCKDKEKLSHYGAWIGNVLGSLAWYKGDYDEAIKHFRKKLRYHQKIGDDMGIATAICNLGVIYKNRCDYKTAVKYYKKALRIAEDVNNLRWIGILNSNIGNIYFEQGEYKRSISLYKKYLELSTELNDRQGIGHASSNMANVYNILGDHVKAIELYKKFLYLSEEIGDLHGTGIACRNLANIYQFLGKYEKALSLYRRDLKLLEIIGDKHGLGRANIHLGLVFYAKGNRKIALKFFIKALGFAEDIGDLQRIGRACCHIASLYLEEGRLPDVKSYMEKAEKNVTMANDKESFIMLYKTRAQLEIFKFNQRKTNSLKDALSYLDKAMTISEKLQFVSSKADCDLMYGHIYLLKKDYVKSEEYLKTALNTYDKLKSKKSLADAYMKLSELHESMYKENKHEKNEKLLKLSRSYFIKASRIYRRIGINR